MIIFKKAADLSGFLQKQKLAGKSSGFVPTMGALHEGHISLVERSLAENDLAVCSIFVNPTQFNNPDDLAKYPRTTEGDIDMLEAAGCTVLFLPQAEEVYPSGTTPVMHYELGYLETILEGSYRPGHFQGVCQVVHRLLGIVMPSTLYLGQKDYQQCMVIRKMIELLGWDKQIKLSIVPTKREPSGLAMSSRNMRLTDAQKQLAERISQTLHFIRLEVKPGFINDVKIRSANYLTAEGFKVDYVEIADANDLQLLDTWDGKTQLIALIAAFVGEVRLIDNLLLDRE